jgi:ABC-type uncharacterized transport system permease subunit
MLTEYLRVKLLMLVYYRTSFLFEILASGAFLLGNIIFWKTVFLKTETVSGLSIGQMYVYLVLIETFAVIYGTFFSGFSKLWRRIVSGDIDILLVSPRMPYFQIFCEGLRPIMLLRFIPVTFLAILTTVYFPVNISPWLLLLGLGLVFISVFIYSLIQFTASCLSFWIGRSTLVDEISDQLPSIQQVPHNVFSVTLRFAIAIVLPLAIGPTQIVMAEHGDMTSIFATVTVLLISAVLWGLIAYVSWVSGLKRYTSFGG